MTKWVALRTCLNLYPRRKRRALGIEPGQLLVFEDGKLSTCKPWLPQTLIHREKMGFGLVSWLYGPLKDPLHDLLTDDTARARGWFRAEAIDQLLADHMPGHDRSPHLYASLMLDVWQREVLDIRPAA